MGLMKANHGFFLLYLLHILLLDVAAWLTLWVFGTSFVPFLLCAVLLSTAQVRSRHLARQERGRARHPRGKLFVGLRRSRARPCAGAALRMWGRVRAERDFAVRGFCLLLGHVCAFISSLPPQPLLHGPPSFCGIYLKLRSPVLP